MIENDKSTGGCLIVDLDSTVTDCIGFVVARAGQPDEPVIVELLDPLFYDVSDTADRTIRSALKMLRRKYPDRTIATHGWFADATRWPKTYRYLRRIGFQIAIEPELKPWWNARFGRPSGEQPGGQQL